MSKKYYTVKFWHGMNGGRNWRPGFVSVRHEALFLFGDNERREGIVGRTAIRCCKNAFGIRIKRSSRLGRSGFWSDDDFRFRCKKMMDEDFAKIYELLEKGKYTRVIIPVVGANDCDVLDEYFCTTGKRLSKLTYNYVCQKINELVSSAAFVEDGEVFHCGAVA